MCNNLSNFCASVSTRPLGGPQTEKNPGALGTCPVCPLVKTALEKEAKHVYYITMITYWWQHSAGWLRSGGHHSTRQSNDHEWSYDRLHLLLLLLLLSAMMLTPAESPIVASTSRISIFLYNRTHVTMQDRAIKFDEIVVPCIIIVYITLICASLLWAPAFWPCSSPIRWAWLQWHILDVLLCGMLPHCDFFWLSCPYLFSRSCAQVEPLDRFSRFCSNDVFPRKNGPFGG